MRCNYGFTANVVPPNQLLDPIEPASAVLAGEPYTLTISSANLSFPVSLAT